MAFQERKIFTSTGELGLKRRTYDRLYWNWRFGTVADVNLLERAFRRMVFQGEKMGKTRYVLRVPVSDKVIEKVWQSELKDYTEVAMPIPEEISSDRTWLLFFSKNHQSRQSMHSIEEIVRVTSFYENHPISIGQRLRDIVKQDFVIQDRILPNQLDQILNLWGETFGWTKKEVMNLSRRLENEQNFPPAIRSVWFASIWRGSEVITAAMAERLVIPLDKKRDINLVESTEWRTKADWEGQGLTTATIVHLNCQVLVQNVEVGDDIGPRGLRYFVFFLSSTKHTRWLIFSKPNSTSVRINFRREGLNESNLLTSP